MMDQILITCDDIGKLIFVISLKYFKADFRLLYSVVCFAHQSTDVAPI